jgi:hypothetical protein
MSKFENAENRVWETALRRLASGDARFLLELLLVPTETDGQGLPTSFQSLPNDAEMRHRIVRALMARPDWAAGNLGRWMTHTGRSARKPTLSPLELDVAEFSIEDARLDGCANDEREALAKAHGVEPETLQKAIAKRRKARQKG